MNSRRRNVATGLVAAVLAVTGVSAHALSDRAIRRAVERTAPSVVTVKFLATTERYGRQEELEGQLTGVLLTRQGLVLLPGAMFENTALGLLGGLGAEPEFASIQVSLADGRRFNGRPVGWDRDTSLGFVQIVDATGQHLPAIRMARRLPLVAETVIVLGALPEGYEPSRTFALTRVNTVFQKPVLVATTQDGLRPFMGGPVVSGEGEMLGVVGREPALESRLGEMLGDSDLDLLLAAFVIPNDRFRPFIDQPPRSNTQEPKGFLGIEMQAVSQDLARYLGLPQESGIHVAGVIQNSPAQAAGLAVGDILLSLNGRRIDATVDGHLESFRRQVRSFAPGTEIDLRVWRDGKELPMRIAIGTSPRMREEALTRNIPGLGLTVRELTVDVRRAYHLDPETQGVVVHGLEAAGPAQIAGLQRGDIIRRVADQPVTGLDGFLAQIDQARKQGVAELLFFVWRGGETLFLNVKPEWARP